MFKIRVQIMTTSSLETGQEHEKGAIAPELENTVESKIPSVERIRNEEVVEKYLAQRVLRLPKSTVQVFASHEESTVL